MAQRVDVDDRLTAVREHHRDIDEHLATVMDRDERPLAQCLGQFYGQPGLIGQQSDRDTARVRHDTGPIIGNGQAGGPRSTLHLRSAFHSGLFELSQVQVSLTGKALPCFYGQCQPINRERSGLGRGWRLRG